MRRKLSTNEDFDKKFGKWAASGPACAIECLFFVDVKAVGDKLRSLVRKEEIIIIAGNSPMRQLIEEVPKACLKVLNELTATDGGGKAGGKGGGKGGNRFVIWWPFRPSDPSFSIHFNGKVVITSTINYDVFEQDVVVNAEKVCAFEPEDIVEKVKAAISSTNGLFSVAVNTMIEPKPYGRRSKQ